jgi:hypothetical protein
LLAPEEANQRNPRTNVHIFENQNGPFKFHMEAGSRETKVSKLSEELRKHSSSRESSKQPSSAMISIFVEGNQKPLKMKSDITATVEEVIKRAIVQFNNETQIGFNTLPLSPDSRIYTLQFAEVCDSMILLKLMTSGRWNTMRRHARFIF